MSQSQQQRPQDHNQQQPGQDTTIKYGDVFNVSGDLATQPVAPQGAAMMQSAETAVFGQTQKGGTAAVMQSAADFNELAGFVGHQEASGVAAVQGVAITEVDVPGARVFTETVGGQVVGQYVQPVSPQQAANDNAGAVDAITIGEALEATARIAGDKPVDQSDAAAIQAAEVRATGVNVVVPGGIASMAQSAASLNQQIESEEDKIKLGDVLMNATVRLPADKAATRQDAEGVVTAELRNNPDLTTKSRGVAASVAATARLNELSQ